MLCSLCIILPTIFLSVAAFKIYLKLTRERCRSQRCLVGKTAVVTGANTGIGYETALDFAKRGAKVILACRDERRAEEARGKIIKETENENVTVRMIDMSSFESVRSFAKQINEEEDRLDILVNNAGVVGIGDKRSKDGHNLLMQINYFSHFLLTNLLIDLLKKTNHSRIVNVSSIAAKYAKNFNINKLDQFTGAWSDYNYSKLCNVLFTKELAHKLEGSGVTTYSLHPGAVTTDIFRHAEGLLKMLFDFLKAFFLKTSEEGAQTTIHCSVAKKIEKYNGEHFDECRRVAPYETVTEQGLSVKLWELTKEIIQVKPGEVIL